MESKEDKVKLTKRQGEVLDFLKEFVAVNGYPPTVREICAGVGLSSSQTAHAHLNRLEQKGFIRLGHAHRGIRIISEEKPADLDGLCKPDVGGVESKLVPLVGRVAAGQPLLAVENIEGYVDLAGVAADPEVFALRVRGDSMVEAGIIDGDYILVRRQDTAENGDIVVALLRDEATVKFFFRERGRIRLEPANSKMRPILAKEVNIIGKVIASFRGYGSVSLIK